MEWGGSQMDKLVWSAWSGRIMFRGQLEKETGDVLIQMWRKIYFMAAMPSRERWTQSGASSIATE
jgi:hypothetical protein